MPYLVSVSQEQVDRGVGTATVRVSWVFGNLIPDVIEIRLRGDVATPATLLAQVEIDSDTKKPISTDIIVSAPNLLVVVVSPRKVENQALTDEMDDDSGQSQYWENFSVQLPPLGVAPRDQGQVPRTKAPTITGYEIGDGTYTVHWTSPVVDQFNVLLGPPEPGGQIELGGSDRGFIWGRITAGKHRFSIQGCTTGIFGSNCSDWVSIEIDMPPEKAFYPWRRWFQLHPETVFDHLTQQITVVSRSPGNLDLFVIGFDNAVWSIAWSQQGGWTSWFQLHPKTVFDHTTQKIAAVARTPSNLDLFVIGFDNGVWSAAWSQQSGWSGWFQIHPETVFDHTKQHVTAVARTPNNLDLFVIGFDNAVWSSAWSPGANWSGWFQIHPETVFDHTRQEVTAVSRAAGNLDLFVIGFDNAVWSAAWSQGNGWTGWFQLHPETVFDHTAQRITAVARTPNNLDLFVIGFDNVVWSAAWSQAGGWTGWFQLHPETVFDHTKQRITAVSRAPGNLDLFVIGFNNAVWSIAWSQESGWSSWFPIHPETVFDRDAQEVAVVSRTPGNLDLFVIGFDNVVWSSYWD